MAELLFSYGTLQLEQVQIDSFGRTLKGSKDKLHGYALKEVEIKDPGVVKSSGKAVHPIAFPSDQHSDFVKGTVFELTADELAQADAYEVDDYKRVKAALASGLHAWVYVAADRLHLG